MLSIVPLVTRIDTWIQLHLGIDDDNPGEIEVNSRNEKYDELTAPGLQGFLDVSPDIDTMYSHGKRYSAARRYAYPYIHSGIQFRTWMLGHYSPILCPFIETTGVRLGGSIDCKIQEQEETKKNDRTPGEQEPECLCNHPVICDLTQVDKANNKSGGSLSLI